MRRLPVAGPRGGEPRGRSQRRRRFEMSEPAGPPEEAIAVAAAVAGTSTTLEVAAANPLRDPRDKRLPRVAGPCVMVLFGVTGDLAKRKLLPAIYDLGNRGLLPPGFSLVGFARRDWKDQDFAKLTHDAVKAHARTPFREEVW